MKELKELNELKGQKELIKEQNQSMNKIKEL